MLVPAVNATAWEQGLGCRLELMRDWGWEDEEGVMVDGVRLARVLKAEGVAVGGVMVDSSQVQGVNDLWQLATVEKN